MKVFISGIIPEIGIEMLEKEGYIVEQWKESRPISTEELIDNLRLRRFNYQMRQINLKMRKIF